MPHGEGGREGKGREGLILGSKLFVQVVDHPWVVFCGSSMVGFIPDARRVAKNS